MWRISRVVGSDDVVGESPLWDEDRGVVSWVDFPSGVLHACEPAAKRWTRTLLNEPLSAIVRTPGGRMVGAAAEGLREVDPVNGSTRRIAGVSHRFPGSRLNDAAVDARGRIWCGSMSLRLTPGHGAVFCLDGDGTVREVAGGFGVCNGLGWSPDQQTFYLVDTLAGTLNAFAFDLEAAAVANGRVLRVFPKHGGKPDGLAVDREGGIWVALWGGGRLMRIAPDGSIQDEILLPTPKPTNCCFAGADESRLYVTTARLGLAAAQLAAAPWSGSLLAVDR